MKPVLFYKTAGPQGCFSNFSPDPVQLLGLNFKTSEAAFQALKFHPHRPDLVEKVWEAKKPSEAAAIGRDRGNPLHPRWEEPIKRTGSDDIWYNERVEDGIVRHEVIPNYVFQYWKDVAMYYVLLCKFSTHRDCKETLLKTGSAPIIEDTSTSGDKYWGWGPNHQGVNRLGKLLMSVRSVLGSKNKDLAASLLIAMDNALRYLDLESELGEGWRLQ